MRFVLITCLALCLSPIALSQTVDHGLCIDVGVTYNRPLDSAEVAALWTQSFQNFLEVSTDLTNEQVGLAREAVRFGQSDNFSITKEWSVEAIGGMVSNVFNIFEKDQHGQIFAGMGHEAQAALAAIGAIDVVACSCTTGAGRGCPDGFPCTVGCYTWGTGEWNGVCKLAAQQQGN